MLGVRLMVISGSVLGAGLCHCFEALDIIYKPNVFLNPLVRYLKVFAHFNIPTCTCYQRSLFMWCFAMVVL